MSVFWKVSPKGEINIVSSRQPLITGYSYYIKKRTAIEVSAERLKVKKKRRILLDKGRK